MCPKEMGKLVKSRGSIILTLYILPPFFNYCNNSRIWKFILIATLLNLTMFSLSLSLSLSLSHGSLISFLSISLLLKKNVQLHVAIIKERTSIVLFLFLFLSRVYYFYIDCNISHFLIFISFLCILFLYRLQYFPLCI